jgi:threonine synthase
VFKPGEVVVCTLTGHGLKDPDRAITFSPKTKTVKAEMEAVVKALGY